MLLPHGAILKFSITQSHEGGSGKVGDAGNVAAAVSTDGAISPDVTGGKAAAGDAESRQEDM
jgi:hypothetical protein